MSSSSVEAAEMSPHNSSQGTGDTGDKQDTEVRMDRPDRLDRALDTRILEIIMHQGIVGLCK